MGALVVGPPILIDPANFSRQNRIEENPFLFQHGSDLYLTLYSQVSLLMSVFKSTDGGLTWAEQDAGGVPISNPDIFWPYYDSVSGIIYFASPDDSIANAKTAFTFDTNTDTYTPAITASAVAATFGGGAFFYRLSGGDLPLLFFGGGNLQYLLESGGAWVGGSTVISGGFPSSNVLQEGTKDSSDRAHFVYSVSGSGFNLVYNQINSSFALGTPTDFGTYSTSSRPTMQVWGSNIVLTYIADTDQSVVVKIGTPLSGPTFASYTVAAVAGSAQVSYPTITLDKDGNLVLFWVETDYGVLPIVDRLWMSTFDGVSAWGAPVLFYDEVDNPPADSQPQIDQFIHTGQAIQLSNGSWVFGTALETSDGPSDHCTGFALVSPPTGSSQTLTLQKTVQGGPASPADFTLIATGGSPEIEISGPGPSVGPDAVNPGTFELSEIAPGGATWNDLTGTWDDNTNTWDGGDYTPVWNCGGATMPTPTSVIVGSGGGDPVVAPTQVPTIDPTFRSLLSGGRFEFLVGANVYQVGWTSSNKLGIFKRAESMAGASWTEMDAFGSPEQGDQSGYGKCTLSGNIISVCYLRIGRTEAAIASFDTVTDTWGAATSALTLPAAVTTFGFVQQASGDFVFLGGWSSQWYYAINSGGSWGPRIQLILNPTIVLDAVIDGTDAIHCLIISVSLGTEYRRLAPVTFAVGSPTGILSSTSLTLGGYPSIFIWNGTSVVVSGVDQFGTEAFKAQAFIGTPLASASFTTYAIAIPAGGHAFTFPKAAEAQDATLHYFYVDAGAGEDKIIQSDFNGSTWSAPSVFYDAVANPPNNKVPDADQEITALDPVNIEGGSPLVAHWSIGAAMQTLQPTEIATAEVIESSSASSAVVCTVTNVFNGPPPNPPGPSQSNPVGCFELLRLDCTLVPARHLPVRGSVK